MMETMAEPQRAPDRQQAWNILCEFTQSESLRKHALAVEACVTAYARRLGEDAALRERFLSEARAVSALEHPHICRLYDVGEWQNRPYFTMERLRGETLRDRLKRGPMPASLHGLLCAHEESQSVRTGSGILHQTVPAPIAECDRRFPTSS